MMQSGQSWFIPRGLLGADSEVERRSIVKEATFFPCAWQISIVILVADALPVCMAAIAGDILPKSNAIAVQTAAKKRNRLIGNKPSKKWGIQRSLDQLNAGLKLFSIRLHHPHDCDYRNYQPDNKQNLHNAHVKPPLVKVKLFYKKIVYLPVLCVRNSGIIAKIVAINKTISKA